jgi:cell division protein FtsW (lipid II flippase)
VARLQPDLAGPQSLWTAIGVGAFVATLVFVRRSRDLERYRYTFALAGLALLLMPLLPVVGREINGSRLWVRFGAVNFQPGELAKIVLCVFFASYIVEKQPLLSAGTRRIVGMWVPEVKYLGPIMLAWGFSLVIMFWERDLGSSLLFFALFITMLWVATDRTVYLVLGGVMFAAGSLLALRTFDHVQRRIDTWLNPWPVADSGGYQIIQAAFAFAAGGFAGTNLSQGSPQRIPAVATDFTFAAIGEELGLLGTVAVLVAFLLMVGSGLRIAMRADSAFEKLLATGLTAIIGLQSFIILGGVTRLIPLTGITLPFVSYGGSSLISNYILLALLLRISHDQTSRAAAEAAAQNHTRLAAA